MGICLVALVGVGILAVAMGAVDITIGEVVSILGAGRMPRPIHPGTNHLVHSLTSFAHGSSGGGALAVVVRLYKGFHQPLAQPYVLGIASGGAFGLRLRSG